VNKKVFFIQDRFGRTVRQDLELFEARMMKDYLETLYHKHYQIHETLTDQGEVI